MTVTEIVPLDKRRSKVVFDEDFALALYRGEIRKYGIEEDSELSDETYREILEEILFKRARERVLYLLKSSDKTEQELRKKLKEGYYPQEAIDQAIEFLKKHRFIDDESYGRRYVEYHSARKSRRQIQFELQQKGLPKELIAEILEENPIDEEEQIRNYIRKKRLDPQNMDQKQRQKAVAALGRKGFSYEVINRVLGSIYDDNCQ
jgi:regulatory protein